MAIPFKKNNPGCPCCGPAENPPGGPNCPCACYAFDDNAEDSSVNNLHLTSTGVSASDYATGHLGKAFKHTGSQYHEHDDHPCFNLSGGINVWFWLQSGYAAPYTWDPTQKQPEGIVTKGTWTDTGNRIMDFDGEWGIFWLPGSPAPNTNGTIYFTVGNGAGGFYDVDYVSTQPEEYSWDFYFFWVSISEDRLYSIKNDSHLTSGFSERAALTGTQTLTSDNKFSIGKGLGGQTYNGVPRPWLIGNVGFCGDIGTKAEMEERAENLYNSGDGRACNHAGYEGGGCCA